MIDGEPEFTGNQVVTEQDLFIAMCDYIAAQLEGRFRLQFPNHTEISEHMVGKLRDKSNRISALQMYYLLANTVSEVGATLTSCSLKGCHQDNNHEYFKEIIILVWDARTLTEEWLRRKGIVPGQSAN